MNENQPKPGAGKTFKLLRIINRYRSLVYIFPS